MYKFEKGSPFGRGRNSVSFAGNGNCQDMENTLICGRLADCPVGADEAYFMCQAVWFKESSDSKCSIYLTPSHIL